MSFKDSFTSICVVLLIAILISFVNPEVSYAAGNPKQGSEKDICREQENTCLPDAQICMLQPAALPYASDETEQGRTYINAGTGDYVRRGFSLRHTGWLFKTAAENELSFTREIYGGKSGANSFDDLFIIHFIHNQDGEKG